MFFSASFRWSAVAFCWTAALAWSLACEDCRASALRSSTSYSMAINRLANDSAAAVYSSTFAVSPELNGYEALSVFGVTRAFGTFSSSAEYAIFLGVAVAVSVAMLVADTLMLRR